MSLLSHLEEQAEYLLSELKRLAASHNSAYGDHDDRLKAIIETLENHVDDNSSSEDATSVDTISLPDTATDAPAEEVSEDAAPVVDSVPDAPVVDTPVAETPAAE